MSVSPVPADAGALRFRLLNDYQRDFPRVDTPFDLIALESGASETTVLETYRELAASGAVSRIGAVFRPGSLGVSALVALAVPPERLAEVAAIVDRHDEVSHNYEREHTLNLWFVVSARDRSSFERIVREIGAASGLEPVVLPLLEEYHIDLGFDLRGTDDAASRVPRSVAATGTFGDDFDLRLAQALQPGLPIVPRPYAALAHAVWSTPAAVRARIDRWIDAGVVRRFGVIVRHWELGFRANAMAVWNVPDELAPDFGAALASEPLVTLAYRRARAMPRWPYNLFAMIHGTHRAAVERTIAEIGERHGLAAFPNAILFSVRRFKQRGARFTPRATATHGPRPQGNRA